MLEPVSVRLPLFTGLSYHVLEWGRDDPTLTHTVVLIHGFLDSAWTFEDMAKYGLAGKYHLVAPDLRGHGDSDRVGPGGYYHFVDYLADLSDVIAMLGRKRVSLVGHSMGGSVAAYFAGTYPDLIHRLALLEGLGPPDNEWSGWPDRLRAWTAAWKRQTTRGASRRYATLEEAAARLCATDPLLMSNRPLALRLAQVSTTQDSEGRFQFKHDPLHLTPAPYLFMVDGAQALWRRVACPTLLVEGSESEMRHAEPELLRRSSAFSNATRMLLEGAGHMMQRHKPQELARMLDGFLSSEMP